MRLLAQTSRCIAASVRLADATMDQTIVTQLMAVGACIISAEGYWLGCPGQAAPPQRANGEQGANGRPLRAMPRRGRPRKGPDYFAPATSFWNLGLPRNGAKFGSILSQPGESR